jgi:hypothetical protein
VEVKLLCSLNSVLSVVLELNLTLPLTLRRRKEDVDVREPVLTEVTGEYEKRKEGE